MTQLHNMTLKELQAKAKELGLKGISALRKQELLDRIETHLQDEKKAESKVEKKPTRATADKKEKIVKTKKETQPQKAAAKQVAPELEDKAKKLGVEDTQGLSGQELVSAIEEKLRIQKERAEKAEKAEKEEKKEEKKQDPVDTVHGFLELIENKDFGFLRFDNFSPGEEDVYVSPVFIRKFNLRTGDKIQGKAKKNNDNDRYRALIYIDLINDMTADQAIHRKGFHQLTPIHPIDRLVLSYNRIELSTRLIDLISPVGRGQRGLIVAPPKAGKTILLQNIAKSIEKNYPEVLSKK